MTSFRFGLFVCLIPLMIACKNAEIATEDEAEPPKPATVSFTGRVEPKIVGHWSTSDKISDLKLEKDGKATIISVTPGPGGGSSTTSNGKWLVEGNRLLMQYRQSSGNEVVVAYGFQQFGNQLILTTTVPKTKSVYMRN